MIELRNVTSGYGQKPVIRDISLDFVPGEVLALLGLNGSGKSTLLKTALGLIRPMAGKILYDGEDLAGLRPRQIALQASYLTQSRNAPAIPAGEMVLHGRFPYLTYPRRYSQADIRAAEAAMDAVGIRQLAHIPVSELSGGQRQEAYLAMMLAQDTPTVCMDEPTTYLDVANQMKLMAMARCLAGKGKAVVLVLHDLALALREADRVAVLDQGLLRFTGTPGEFLSSGAAGGVFGVEIHAAATDHGIQYYCTPGKEG